MRTITLSEGSKIPVLGFGTWQLEGEVAKRAVKTALDTGYRHIDTALIYGNHSEIAEAIEESGIDRDELFITSKIWRDRLDRAGVKEQTEQVLTELNSDYVDLLLVHWPNDQLDIDETMAAMEEVKKEGKAKNIGVSNFNIQRLRSALDASSSLAMNQVEFHPSLNQQSLLGFCRKNQVAVTGYSPLAQGQDLSIQEIKDIAEKIDKPASQVIINWMLQKDIIVIPRSDDPDHIADNYQAATWELSDWAIKEIDDLSLWNRILNPPFADFDD